MAKRDSSKKPQNTSFAMRENLTTREERLYQAIIDQNVADDVMNRLEEECLSGENVMKRFTDYADREADTEQGVEDYEYQIVALDTLLDSYFHQRAREITGYSAQDIYPSAGQPVVENDVVGLYENLGFSSEAAEEAAIRVTEIMTEAIDNLKEQWKDPEGPDTPPASHGEKIAGQKSQGTKRARR